MLALRLRFIPALLGLALLVVVLPGEPRPAAASRFSRVYINGQAVPVFFNDGDSFRIEGGPWRDRRSRLAGFNTLESYGPVHEWGDWHPYELYVNAKQATLNARRGVWHCTADGETDTYGRMLLDCPDLAVDQIRKGLAHAMNVDDEPSRPEYLRAQREAIENRRGMWAHGAPPFILTSLHSANEDVERDSHYNRLISTRDGHSEKWEHNEVYDECERVCATVAVADDTEIRRVAAMLRADETLAPRLAELSNLLLVEVVDRFARLGELPAWVEEDLQAPLRDRLAAARTEGNLSDPEQERVSCMYYVDFLRRYGRNRAACLLGHGASAAQ